MTNTTRTIIGADRIEMHFKICRVQSNLMESTQGIICHWMDWIDDREILQIQNIIYKEHFPDVMVDNIIDYVFKNIKIQFFLFNFSVFFIIFVFSKGCFFLFKTVNLPAPLFLKILLFLKK